MTTKPIGFQTATSLVIASMIGTGVFTSLGYQVLGIHSVFALLMLWVIGGIASLCGALAYGELGAAMPRSGGEYRYLSEIFHPALGFLSGWVSATVGFAAPVALAAMAMGDYTSKVFPSIRPMGLAAAAVILLTLIHAGNLRLGSWLQDVFTALKLILIVVFIAAGFVVGPAAGHQIRLMPDGSTWSEIFSQSFAISLFFVSYSYSGWNTSAYIAGEIKDPQRNLPRSLFWGTLAVTLLYVLLNFVFLYTTPADKLAGQVDVGYIAADSIFGALGGKIMGIMIALLLVSSVSSWIMAGPRVAQTMGQDIPLLGIFAKTTRTGIPAFAIGVQSLISLLLIRTSTFDQVLTYIGFTLNLFTLMTVTGLIMLRIKRPEMQRPYRTWGYPYTVIVFLLIGLWLLVYGLIYKPTESLMGLGTVLTGLAVYGLGKNKSILRVLKKAGLLGTASDPEVL
ncbi:MAG TPA: amino acid permease [Terriglobia bacterium]|nr:amino acid permease [Terriglobia bacterium]